MSELSVRLAQVVPPRTVEHEALARLEMIIQLVETAHARLAADRRQCGSTPPYRGVERRTISRDRRLTETLPQLQQAATQSRSVLRVLVPQTLHARLAAGSRPAPLLGRIHGTTPSMR